MFEHLDEVPWSDLSHAYGRATEVPGPVRALANGDDGALRDLFGNRACRDAIAAIEAG